MGPRLHGCRVLLTRPVEQAEAWRRTLHAAGATVVDYPTIEVGPPPDWAPLDASLARLSDYEWLVFTSANAVRFTLQRWPAGPAPSDLRMPRVAAVGSQTAGALSDRGLEVACLPPVESQDGLIAVFGQLPPGTRVLFPQAIGGREALTAALRARGCTVDVVPASQTLPARGPARPPTFRRRHLRQPVGPARAGRSPRRRSAGWPAAGGHRRHHRRRGRRPRPGGGQRPRPPDRGGRRSIALVYARPRIALAEAGSARRSQSAGGVGPSEGPTYNRH